MAALLPPLAYVHAAGTAQGLTDVGAPPHPSDLYDYGAIAEDRGALPATPEELAHAKATFDRDGLVVFSRGLEASAPALRAAVDALKDGSNADFRDALLAQRRARGGAPPDFTNGAKIPWVQYEAGCEVAEPLEPGAASSDRSEFSRENPTPSHSVGPAPPTACARPWASPSTRDRSASAPSRTRA